MIKKDNRGGARVGAGAKGLYGEKTLLIAFKVPTSKFTELRIYVRKKLNEWKVK